MMMKGSRELWLVFLLQSWAGLGFPSLLSCTSASFDFDFVVPCLRLLRKLVLIMIIKVI